MTQNQPLTQVNVASVGEEIGYELGTQMIQDYQLANPNDVHSYVIGRNIIDQILNQPGCVAVKFYNAYNEVGEKTLVYVGLNNIKEVIFQYVTINREGVLVSNPGIVADRAERGDRGGGGTPNIDTEGWNWDIE